ncbi:MAG: hypothetical protein L6R36_004788 [Xanthoria steineri]|nr:MAG: hypothetical protein L6R36_004788 [Xanthoria steineri]
MTARREEPSEGGRASGGSVGGEEKGQKMKHALNAQAAAAYSRAVLANGSDYDYQAGCRE